MLYISGLLFGAMIVVANSLYNQAVQNASFEPTVEFILSRKMAGLLLSPHFIGGLAIFLVATLINFWMFTKFDFSAIQAVTVPVVLSLSLLVGWQFLNESISLINVVGMGVMVAGVILATLR